MSSPSLQPHGLRDRPPGRKGKMMANYYFAFSNDDPMRSKYPESKMTIEKMRELFVGTFIQVGDEPHDVNRVADIWTEEQAKKYFND